MNIYNEIEQLIQYGLQKKLITQWDIEVVRNKILEVLELTDFEWSNQLAEEKYILQEIMGNILDWAADNDRLPENTITYRDLLDTKVMGCFVPLPSEINRKFYKTYDNEGSEKATKWFYELSKDVDYIRTDRIAKNEEWLVGTDYGDIEITINLSKPELDPVAIAAAKKLAQNNYPKCLLCKENAGYGGRVNHPARQNHRIIPVELNKEQWFFQFSPYVYYNEHTICFSAEHKPMQITKETFKRLLQFVEKFPHYFIGSNADLPIVGGSILSHEHYQGGCHEFPMAKAEIEEYFLLEELPNVRAGIVKWPMSVIRLQGESIQDLIDASDYILQSWIAYSDPGAEIIAYTDSIRHNTITPIARMRDGLFEIDLVLRNNCINDEHPLGIYHPHKEVHHIKKENIGLIEVMGLAVLPGRLKEEMALLEELLLLEDCEQNIYNHAEIVKHLDWAKEIKRKYHDLSKENVGTIIKKEIGIVFEKILHHAGVYKRTDAGKLAFLKFIKKLRGN
ncbi:UDP-glucose--hexose-1-phosphate uridylyltransferase [Niallia nealsonii]|uniref:Galactose-1-phosphate uridylyltransferase n=1 Tax=Niallia nealsonii TaxID=115979 RepID=A0A2N0Z7W7_9BACI|nr:UDP-glucose--hexose-1-phosphate uridylyltransferase [Niallia nealsonii]PKG25598.1 UDP-glucose--hexose-1-phosphate uridylyltransferase [Niallia nealsonii]